MNQWPTDPARPLYGWVACAWVATAAVLGGVTLMAGRVEWWPALAAAGVAGGLSAAVAVPLLAWGMRRVEADPSPDGLSAAAGAALLATGLRTTVAVAAAAAMVRFGGFPQHATLLMLVPFYFTLLAAECFALGRTLWKVDGEGREFKRTSNIELPTSNVEGQTDGAGCP